MTIAHEAFFDTDTRTTPVTRPGNGAVGPVIAHLACLDVEGRRSGSAWSQPPAATVSSQFDQIPYARHRASGDSLDFNRSLSVLGRRFGPGLNLASAGLLHLAGEFL